MYRKDVLRAAGIEMPVAPDVAAGRRHRPADQQAGHGRHLPAGQAGLGRARRDVHDRAEHVRWNVVVREGERLSGRGDGQSGGFRKALQFYVDLVRDAGERDAASSSATTSASRST